MISILRYLSQAKAISDRTKQLQNALFRTLTVQVCLLFRNHIYPYFRPSFPSFFFTPMQATRYWCHCSESIAACSGLLRKRVRWQILNRSNFSDFISVGCSCFPPFDAIATILLMRDYRNTVWALATCRFPFFKSCSLLILNYFRPSMSRALQSSVSKVSPVSLTNVESRR